MLFWEFQEQNFIIIIIITIISLPAYCKTNQVPV